MNRTPTPGYIAPIPPKKDGSSTPDKLARHRQADLYNYNMETEGARIHVEVWLHEEITPPQSAEIFLAMEELRRAVWRATKEARRITEAAQQPPQK